MPFYVIVKKSNLQQADLRRIPGRLELSQVEKDSLSKEEAESLQQSYSKLNARLEELQKFEQQNAAPTSFQIMICYNELDVSEFKNDQQKIHDFYRQLVPLTPEELTVSGVAAEFTHYALNLRRKYLDAFLLDFGRYLFAKKFPHFRESKEATNLYEHGDVTTIYFNLSPSDNRELYRQLKQLKESLYAGEITVQDYIVRASELDEVVLNASEAKDIKVVTPQNNILLASNGAEFFSSYTVEFMPLPQLKPRSKKIYKELSFHEDLTQDFIAAEKIDAVAVNIEFEQHVRAVRIKHEADRLSQTISLGRLIHEGIYYAKDSAARKSYEIAINRILALSPSPKNLSSLQAELSNFAEEKTAINMQDLRELAVMMRAAHTRYKNDFYKTFAAIGGEYFNQFQAALRVIDVKCKSVEQHVAELEKKEKAAIAAIEADDAKKLQQLLDTAKAMKQSRSKAAAKVKADSVEKFDAPSNSVDMFSELRAHLGKMQLTLSNELTRFGYVAWRDNLLDANIKKLNQLICNARDVTKVNSVKKMDEILKQIRSVLYGVGVLLPKSKVIGNLSIQITSELGQLLGKSDSKEAKFSAKH